jgi:hypothetical protein
MGKTVEDLTNRRKTNILNVGYDSVNYYLVDQDSGLLLIDAGWPGTLPEFQSILKRRLVQLQRFQAPAGDALPSGPCWSGQGGETKGRYAHRKWKAQ